MPHRTLEADPPPPVETILKTLQPSMSVAVGLVGVVVWAYTTFVTVATLNSKVDEINQKIQDRYIQAIEHSDANYAKMSTQITALQAMMGEIRDNLRILQTKIMDKR